MKLRSKAPILREWKGTTHVSTDPSASPDGTPIMVFEGPEGAVGPAEAHIYGYEIPRRHGRRTGEVAGRRLWYAVFGEIEAEKKM